MEHQSREETPSSDDEPMTKKRRVGEKRNADGDVETNQVATNTNSDQAIAVKPPLSVLESVVAKIFGYTQDDNEASSDLAKCAVDCYFEALKRNVEREKDQQMVSFRGEIECHVNTVEELRQTLQEKSDAQAKAMAECEGKRKLQDEEMATLRQAMRKEIDAQAGTISVLQQDVKQKGQTITELCADSEKQHQSFESYRLSMEEKVNAQITTISKVQQEIKLKTGLVTSLGHSRDKLSTENEDLRKSLESCRREIQAEKWDTECVRRAAVREMQILQ